MPVQEPSVTEANRLYWETDDSVASIADRLDVSRRALYEAVRPKSAGAACESCGAELAFENRSARKHGLAVCAACGADHRADTPADVDLHAGADARGHAEAHGAATAPGYARSPAAGPTLGGLAFDVVRGDQRVDTIIDQRGPRATRVAWGEGVRDPDLRHRAVVLGSVAIAGVAVGTMAAIFATRRDS